MTYEPEPNVNDLDITIVEKKNSSKTDRVVFGEDGLECWITMPDSDIMMKAIGGFTLEEAFDGNPCAALTPVLRSALRKLEKEEQTEEVIYYLGKLAEMLAWGEKFPTGVWDVC